MKREIKFRGYSVEQSKWLYGGLLIFADGTAIMPDGETEDGKMITSPVDPDSIGQFTDLKDKNGVDIYEGDILRLHEYQGEVYRSVIFHNGAFCLHGFNWERKTAEVIGNIHQTPELL